MSEETMPKIRLSIGTWIVVFGLVSGTVGTFTLAQTQIAANERRIDRLELRDEQTRIDYAVMRELLTRIDERLAEVRRKQESVGAAAAK